MSAPADELRDSGTACDIGCCIRIRSLAHREPIGSGLSWTRPMCEVRPDPAAYATGFDLASLDETGMRITTDEYTRPDRIFL